MTFSVTIAAIGEGITLDDMGQIIRDNNERWVRVNHPLWPVHEPLGLHWRAENGGYPLTLVAATGEEVRVIVTDPLIQRKKSFEKWFGRNHELLAFEDRINTYGKPTFFFEHDNRVWCAIMAAANSNDTIRIYRDLLRPSVPSIIKPDEYNIPSNMLYWLLHIFEETDGTIQHAQAPLMRLNDVRGYRGQSLGGIVRGRGVGITDHLSTLGVVAENAEFTALEIEMTFGNDRLCFALWFNGSCMVDERNSRCAFAHTPNPQHRQILLTFFIYSRVLPALKAKYEETVANGLWSENHRQEFVRRTALELANAARTRADELQA